MTICRDEEQESKTGAKGRECWWFPSLIKDDCSKEETGVEERTMGDLLGCQRVEGGIEFHKMQDLLHEVGEGVCRLCQSNVGRIRGMGHAPYYDDILDYLAVQC